MKISVLTVCRNAEGTIAHTITSFLEQVYPAQEMALVDGALRDRAVAIAKSFRTPEIRNTSEPDRCMYHALNKSLRLYPCNAVGVLSADDLYHDRGILSRVAEALHSHDATQGDLDFHDEWGQVF